MINGLGVLGWGVGGIEAEAAMLNQPVSMLIPQVIGVRLSGSLREGSTSTDLVLTITEMLRKEGVVGKFVEFFGPGLHTLPLADRATIGNMAPEYGATCGIFPIDAETLKFLALTGRSARADCAGRGLLQRARDVPHSRYAGGELYQGPPSRSRFGRAQRRRTEASAGSRVSRFGGQELRRGFPGLMKPSSKAAAAHTNGDEIRKNLHHGSVVIAAITSCTNTSNPSVMIAAGLLAKKAVERGLSTPPWVKTSLAPGSKVVTEYYDAAGLTPYLEKLHFNLVGYGCTTCIGNSGPLPAEVSQVVNDSDLVVASVLSGNRNFEGRINSEVRANYLMSPPLVVAFALAGRIDFNPVNEPLGNGKDGKPGLSARHLADRKRSGRHHSPAPSTPDNIVRHTPRFSKATRSGGGSMCRRAKPSRGRTVPRTSKRHRISMTCPSRFRR